METMHKDLAQATKVETVSSDNNLFVEVGGSVVRFPVSNLLERVAGDSSGAAEALEKLSEAIENNPDIVEAILTPISKNSETTEKFDAEHQQFTVTGAIAKSTGNLSTASTGWRTTCFIPLSLTHPLTAKFANDSALGGIFFYDAQQQYISAVTHDTSLPTEITIQPEDYPNNAVFFRVSTPYASVSISYYTNGTTAEAREGAITDAILASKKLPLIDEWNDEFGSQGGYQPKTDKYRLLDTDFNSEEAMRIMSYRGLQLGSGLCNHYGAKSLPATVVASEGVIPYDFCFYKSPLLEIIPAFKSYNYITSSNLNSMFDGCERLRIIKPVFYLTNTKTANSCFARCYALEEVHLKYLKISISFADCPNISSASLSEAVSNAANTETITITVHADVYAKLTDTSNTEWNAVLTAAAAKQISFATA